MVMSGSPLLIQNGVPVGKHWVDEDEIFHNLHDEHPYRHQGMRHPRTAIGLTSDNHMIMTVVDGRAEQAAGMTAR